jgi:hypothetical protein
MSRTPRQLHDAAFEIVGGEIAALKLMQRADDAIEWGLVHSGREDDLEMQALAITALMQASVLLAGCRAPDLAAGMRALAAYFVFMIEAERDIQQTFGPLS